jgi:hypothetical protein
MARTGPARERVRSLERARSEQGTTVLGSSPSANLEAKFDGKGPLGARSLACLLFEL